MQKDGCSTDCFTGINFSPHIWVAFQCKWCWDRNWSWVHWSHFLMTCSICQSAAGQTGGDRAVNCFSCHVCSQWLLPFPPVFMTPQRAFYFHHMLSCRVTCGIKGLPAALLYQSLGQWTLTCSVMPFSEHYIIFYKSGKKWGAANYVNKDIKTGNWGKKRMWENSAILWITVNNVTHTRGK